MASWKVTRMQYCPNPVLQEITPAAQSCGVKGPPGPYLTLFTLLGFYLTMPGTI